jgi:hypothetical protein
MHLRVARHRLDCVVNFFPHTSTVANAFVSQDHKEELKSLLEWGDVDMNITIYSESYDTLTEHTTHCIRAQSHVVYRVLHVALLWDTRHVDVHSRSNATNFTRLAAELPHWRRGKQGIDERRPPGNVGGAGVGAVGLGHVEPVEEEGRGLEYLVR